MTPRHDHAAPHAEPHAPREHREKAPKRARIAILTVSDTRTPDSDASGARLRALVVEAGHAVAWHRLVRDEVGEVRAALEDAMGDPAVDAFIATGGTGVSPRDVTVEAVAPLLDKELPGFGELFRRLSFETVGTAAMLSRATAGIARGKPLFLLPGSVDAVDLATRRLILPEIGHLLALATRSPP